MPVFPRFSVSQIAQMSSMERWVIAGCALVFGVFMIAGGVWVLVRK